VTAAPKFKEKEEDTLDEYLLANNFSSEKK